MSNTKKRREQGLFAGAMETAMAAAMTKGNGAMRLAQAVASATAEAAERSGQHPGWANIIPSVLDALSQQYANNGYVDGRLVKLLMDCGRAADSREDCDL